jgi:hypothetical protein
MSELESIPKQEALDRVHALVVQVQDEEVHTDFVPGFAWWLCTNQKNPVPGQLPFWEQLGITHACFLEHFGPHWMTDYIELVLQFDDLRRQKYGAVY